MTLVKINSRKGIIASLSKKKLETVSAHLALHYVKEAFFDMYSFPTLLHKFLRTNFSLETICITHKKVIKR